MRSLLSAIVKFVADADSVTSVASSMLVVVASFCFATFVSAGLLWHFEWPLVLSPVGGLIVVGVMPALWNDD
ncbi:hypothetical protein N9M70_00530 [Luminiphilus sp.]|nr:hypothetical protein [Luminiphilus sp.]